MGRLTLSSTERIKNSTEISTLIRQGQAFFLAPFKVHYLWSSSQSTPPLRVAFAVPKKKFGRAVDRNALKRLCREAYRQNKELLYPLLESGKGQLNILFVYQKTSKLKFEDIQKVMVDCMHKIIKQNG